MNLRNIILSVLREELSPESSKPIHPVEPSADQVVSDREEIFARVATLKQQAVNIGVREADLNGDVAHMARLEAELNELRVRVSNDHARLWCEKVENMFALEKEFALLRTTSSRQLDQFISSMTVEYDRLVKLVPREEIQYGERNLLADNPKAPRYVYSEAPAISRRAKAVIAARARAEELKLLARSEAELTEELDQLRAALPLPRDKFEVVRI